MGSRIRNDKIVIFPPELLPAPEIGESAEVLICLDHEGDGQCPNCVKVPIVVGVYGVAVSSVRARFRGVLSGF
jgi:hypothetical protein